VKTLEEIENEELAEFARRVLEAFEQGPEAFANFVRTELIAREHEFDRQMRRPN